jgi:hypothetical protein
MAVVTKVGDGSNTLFWKDRWLNGKRIKDIAPAVYAMVPKRIINTRKVKEAMLNLRWVTDFQGALTVPVLVEYLELYQALDQVKLQSEIPDEHTWGSLQQANSPLSRLMRPCSRDPSLLSRQREFGGPGLPASVDFLFGWWSTIGAGLPTS